MHIVPLGNLSMTILAGQIRRKITISCPEVSSFDLLTPHKDDVQIESRHKSAQVGRSFSV